MASKLLHGSQVSKVSTSWCLAQGLSNLTALLHNMHAITFHHVRRKTNSVADFLANSGVNSTSDDSQHPDSIKLSVVSFLKILVTTSHDLWPLGLVGDKTCPHHPSHERRHSAQDPPNVEDYS